MITIIKGEVADTRQQPNIQATHQITAAERQSFSPAAPHKKRKKKKKSRTPSKRVD